MSFSVLSPTRGPARRVAITIAAALSLVAGGCGSSADQEPGTTGDAVRASTSGDPVRSSPLLGVLSAGKGSYDNGTLTLEDVDPQGVWFTDRPVREAGTDGLEGLLQLFFAGDVPPNAAVNVAGAPSTQDLAVVELAKPRYDADAGTLAFSAKLISRDAPRRDRVDRAVTHPGIAAALGRQDGALPARFGRTTIFIDAAEDTAETPDEQNLEAHFPAFRQAVLNLQPVLDDYRALVRKSPSECLTDYEDFLANIMYGLIETLPADVKELLADTEANGGTLPDRDREKLQAVDEALDGAKQTTAFAAGRYQIIERGRAKCP